MTTRLPRWDGGTLVYDRCGTPGSSPALVIHGMAENRREVLPLARLLAEAGGVYDVVVPDLPAHGDSPGGPADLGIETLASAIAELCDGLGIDGCAVIGHSLGGAVATALAAARPDLVSTAVLLDPGMAFPAGTMDGLAQMYNAITAENLDATLRDTLPPMLFGPDDDEAMTERVLAGMIDIGAESFAAMGHGLMDFDGRQAISDVTAPVLLIVTDQPMSETADVKRYGQNVRVETAHGVSHQGLVHDTGVHTEIARFLAYE